MPVEFLERVTRDGQAGLDINPHRGQSRALRSRARFILVLAGTQSGKSVLGPAWLFDEIKARGPGDYMVVAPTYPILGLKALPEFLRLFREHLQLGDFTGGAPRRFVFSQRGEQKVFGAPQRTPTVVYFAHASEPDSLEAATIKGLWADEAGQKNFKGGSWEALLRRMAIHRARALLTTTPYDLGWLKQQLYDRAMAGDTSIEVVNFESTLNPAFPRAEYEERRATMPAWRFNMAYRGLFERPAGVIYDCFDTSLHVVPRFALPDAWPRFLGLDFGGVNTAGVFIAEEQDSQAKATGRFYLHREYLAGGRTARDHAEHVLRGEPGVPTCVGGSKSEGQWRQEFRAGGLPVRSPIVREVEVGISRLYGLIKQGRLLVFDDCARVLEELATYSREIDSAGQPLEEISDKETFHLLDAARYILGWVVGLRDRRIV